MSPSVCPSPRGGSSPGGAAARGRGFESFPGRQIFSIELRAPAGALPLSDLLPPSVECGSNPEGQAKRMRRDGIGVRVGLGLLLGVASTPSLPAQAGPSSDGVVFLVADGLRQDLVQEWSSRRSLPALRKLSRRGASAAEGGLLTQAPASSGAGWYTLATGAWPAVTGSPGNSFHVNGQPFASRSGAFDAGVLQAETLAQAAERGGRRVAQLEWGGGANGPIQGPTVDFRSFYSGRGVATNYVAPGDLAGPIAAFGLQFDHPAGYAGQSPFPGAAPAPAAGWSGVPPSYSPPMEMRLRVLDAGVDAYGLNAYLYDPTDDGATGYDRVLLAPSKDGAAGVSLAEGEWAGLRVALVDGRTAGLLVKVERLAPDLSAVRLYHSSVSRVEVLWPGWPGEAGFGDFAEYVAQTFPVSSPADAAVVEAGIVSEETFVEQALSFEDGHRPLIEYVLEKHQPDLVMAGYPVIGDLSRQFLGLVTERLPNGDPNPAYDDANLDGTPDGRVEARTAFLRRAYEGADALLALIQAGMPKKTASFVASGHGFAPQFLAIDASRPLVDLGLLSIPQTSSCKPSVGETIGKAKACWSGGTLHVYLNLAGRDPAGDGFQQVAAADEAATVAAVRAAYEGLSDPNDWSGDGQPEAWPPIDRSFTKAEARYVPNGSGAGADLAHPTRTGDVVVFARPPYQFDGATPGTLVSPSHFFGQHGYQPDLAQPEANADARGALLAAGKGIARAKPSGLRTIDLAPTIAYLLRIPLPQDAEGRVRLDLLKGGGRVRAVPILGLADFHGQLEPTTALVDGLAVSVGGAAQLATLFDEEAAGWPVPPLLVAAGDNVGASPPSSSLLGDVPAIDAENAWGLDATGYGHHEFDDGVDALLAHQARAEFPFLGANVVETASGGNPDWVEASVVFESGKVRVGVIGIALESTPALLPPGRTDGLSFLPAVDAIRSESERLRRMGAKVQVVLIHEGSTAGSNAAGVAPAVPWEGPIDAIVEAIQDTGVDVVLGGHTHRVTNTTIGRILVLQSRDAGAGYSLAQLVVRGRDVEWAGGASRVARSLGVAPRADVQAIVDDANAASASLRNQVVGTQAFDVQRAPTRLYESAMGNLVADALRFRYAGVDAALTNSGSLRADLFCNPPSAGEAPCEITWGELFAVLPFGNRTVIETLTGAQLEAALLNGFAPFCNAAIGTSRFPQISGLLVTFACNGAAPAVTGMWLAPPGALLVPIGPADSVRIVTNDFLFAGGDGYDALAEGTDVLTPGDSVLDVTVDHIAAGSPVGPVVEGRIIGP